MSLSDESAKVAPKYEHLIEKVKKRAANGRPYILEYKKCVI